jgi:predicted Zn-dependent protease
MAAAGRTVPRAGSPVGAASIADVLDRDLAADVLRAARARGGAFAELFVEERLGVSVHLDDGKVEEVTTGLDRGAGVRVGYGTSFGYAYSNRLDRDALLQAAEAAAASVSDGGPGAVVDLRALEPPVVHSALVDASSIPTEQKVAWVRKADEAARALGPEIVQVTATYGDSVQRVLVAASDGRWVDELRPRVRLSVNAVAARDGNIQTGFHGPAGLAGTELIDANPPAATAEVAARRAITMLDAAPAPAGETAVVLAPGMGGVLFHEAPASTAAGSASASRPRSWTAWTTPRSRTRGVRSRSTTKGRRRSARCCSRTGCCRDGCTTGFVPRRTASSPAATAGDSRTRTRRSRA